MMDFTINWSEFWQNARIHVSDLGNIHAPKSPNLLVVYCERANMYGKIYFMRISSLEMCKLHNILEYNAHHLLLLFYTHLIVTTATEQSFEKIIYLMIFKN